MAVFPVLPFIFYFTFIYFSSLFWSLFHPPVVIWSSSLCYPLFIFSYVIPAAIWPSKNFTAAEDNHLVCWFLSEWEKWVVELLWIHGRIRFGLTFVWRLEFVWTFCSLTFSVLLETKAFNHSIGIFSSSDSNDSKLHQSQITSSFNLL